MCMHAYIFLNNFCFILPKYKYYSISYILFLFFCLLVYPEHLEKYLDFVT